MNEAAQTYAMLFKLATASRETELVKTAVGQISSPAARLVSILRNPKTAWGVGATGLGAAGLGIPLAYSAGERVGDEKGKFVRNLAFGGGLLSGLAAPTILKGLGQIVGLTPTSGTG